MHFLGTEKFGYGSGILSVGLLLHYPVTLKLECEVRVDIGTWGIRRTQDGILLIVTLPRASLQFRHVRRSAAGPPNLNRLESKAITRPENVAHVLVCESNRGVSESCAGLVERRAFGIRVVGHLQRMLDNTDAARGRYKQYEWDQRSEALAEFDHGAFCCYVAPRSP
jgi:hypothetical protein